MSCKSHFILTWVVPVFMLVGCASSSGGGGSIDPGTTTFTVTDDGGGTAYVVNGSNNAGITLQRNHAYTFNVTAPGHPFYIMSVQGTNTTNAYTSGVSGNGTSTGTLTFTVPAGAPNTLFYDCSVHSSMTGTITVTN